MAEAAVENGVHEMSVEDSYIIPQEQAVLEHLEWFKDQKLGFMMHWAPVSQWGIVESWSMCEHTPWSRYPHDDWAQKEINWIDDLEEFRKQLHDTNKTFNPIKFAPKRWAQLAKECGFKYLLFTTKHHDGFCMYDTKYTDYKITAPDCPFHTSENADIVKGLCNAFREEGLGISLYFSKPDWDSPYFWVPEFENTYSCNTNYNVWEKPEIWEKFTEFTHNQLKELTGNYGKVDVLWLDGGWVSPDMANQDIHLEKVIPEIRQTTQPHLIVADRGVGGAYENILTPEQTCPDHPIMVPWESCITIGDDFSYRYGCNVHQKSMKQLIHMFLDIVAKGGNLALNLTPQPDGELPENQISAINEMGQWLKINGEGIYGTRPFAPYNKRNICYTQKEDAVYAFLLYRRDYQPVRQMILEFEKEVDKIVCLRTGEEMKFRQEDGLAFVDTSKLSLYNMKYADGFKVTFK